jgi:hypothetical protein
MPLNFLTAYCYHSVVSESTDAARWSGYGHLPHISTGKCNFTIELCAGTVNLNGQWFA